MFFSFALSLYSSIYFWAYRKFITFLLRFTVLFLVFDFYLSICYLVASLLILHLLLDQQMCFSFLCWYFIKLYTFWCAYREHILCKCFNASIWILFSYNFHLLIGKNMYVCCVLCFKNFYLSFSIFKMLTQFFSSLYTCISS